MERYHAIAFKGSLVATDALLRAVEAGLPVPPVESQRWWYQSFVSCSSLRGSRQPCKDAVIEASAQALFGRSAAWTPSDYLWPFLAELARDAKTACQNMVAATFHQQLVKAYRRELIMWENAEARVIDRKVAFRIVNHYVRLVTGHRNVTVLTPDDLPLELGLRLEALTRRWVAEFSEVLPCPHSSFIYGLSGSGCTRLRKLLGWMHQLQVHRSACLRELQARLPASTRTSAEGGLQC